MAREKEEKINLLSEDSRKMMEEYKKRTQELADVKRNLMESQGKLRELAKIAEGQRAAAHREAEQSSGGQPTAKDVRRVADQHRGREGSQEVRVLVSPPPTQGSLNVHVQPSETVRPWDEQINRAADLMESDEFRKGVPELISSYDAARLNRARAGIARVIQLLTSIDREVAKAKRRRSSVQPHFNGVRTRPQPSPCP